MVGGYRIPQQGQHVGALDVLDHRQRAGDVVEEWRVLDIGGILLPHVGGCLRHFNGLPLLVAGKHFGIFLVEHAGADLGHRLGDFLAAGPDVLQVHRIALLVITQRLAADVDTHGAGQRVSDDQGRRGQPVGFYQWVHAAFEVTVTGQHRGHGEVGLLDGFFDRLGQGPGVADTGGAAVAHQVEAKLVQVLGEARSLVVVGDHFRARRQGAFHPGLAGQAFFHGFLCHQPGRHHHAGVGGVGAGGNRGDHHRAVFQAIGVAFVFIIRLADQVRIAHGNAATAFAFQAAFFFAGGFELQVEKIAERLAHVWQGNAILWAFGPGKAGLDSAHVQGQGVGEDRLLAGIAPQALGLGIGFHQLDRLGRAAGQAQVVQGHLIHREKATGRAVFRGHVGDGGAVGQGQIGQAVAVEFDELAHHAFLAQHLCHGQHQVGGGDAFLELAGELEADHFRDQHRHRLAEHRRLGFDAAHAPAEYAEAVDHGGVGVGADQGVGEGVGAAVFLFGPHGAAQVFEVDLVADAGARRYHAEVVEGALAPAQEGVAFAVALHFDIDVLLEGAGAAELVDHHRVVNHQVHR